MLIIWWSNRKFPLFFFFFEFVIYFHPSAGAYVEKGRWLTPLGEALCENPALQLVIPMRARRAPPLPPSPSPDLCALLLDMLAFDPDARPTALQLQERVYRATDTHWSQKILFVYLDPIRRLLFLPILRTLCWILLLALWDVYSLYLLVCLRSHAVTLQIF